MGYFGVLVGLLGLLGSSIGATLGVELASKNLVSGTPFRRVPDTRLLDASLTPIWGTLGSFWAAWVPNVLEPKRNMDQSSGYVNNT